MTDFAYLVTTHPEWKKLIAGLEDSLTRQWRRATSVDDRERLWHELKALGEIRRKIEAQVRTNAET